MATATTTTVSPLPVVLTLAQRELVRFFRQRNRVVGALVQPIMFWGLFSLGLRSKELGSSIFLPRHDRDDSVVHGDLCHDFDH